MAQWIKDELPKEFFKKTENIDAQRLYGDMMQWTESQERFKQTEKTKFARVADGWLVAFAKVSGRVVATHEIFFEDSRKIKIPNICEKFGVSYADPFDMLEDVGARFDLR